MKFIEKELRLKKTSIYLTYFLVAGFFGISVLYRGWSFPVEDIYGCYYLSTKKHVDRVCLYRNGQYEQFFSETDSAPQQYNQNSWRIFSYSSGGSVFFAGSLNEFITRDDSGEMESFMNIDIQPYRDLFGNVLFTRGISSSGAFREYYRE